MIVLRCSKKIGQTTKHMIHFVPNMYVSGKISALRPPHTYTKSEVFWNSNGFRKPSKTARFQDLRVFAGFCGSLAFLRVFFSPGFCVFFPQSFEALQQIFWPFSLSPKTCNQIPNIEDQSSIKMFWSNTNIFLGFAGSRDMIYYDTIYLIQYILYNISYTIYLIHYIYNYIQYIYMRIECRLRTDVH